MSEQTTDVYVLKDANGLIRADLVHLDNVFPTLDYVPNRHTIEQVAFIAGQRAVIQYIAEKMVAKRNELTSSL